MLSSLTALLSRGLFAAPADTPMPEPEGEASGFAGIFSELGGQSSNPESGLSEETVPHQKPSDVVSVEVRTEAKFATGDTVGAEYNENSDDPEIGPRVTLPMPPEFGLQPTALPPNQPGGAPRVLQRDLIGMPIQPNDVDEETPTVILPGGRARPESTAENSPATLSPQSLEAQAPVKRMLDLSEVKAQGFIAADLSAAPVSGRDGADLQRSFSGEIRRKPSMSGRHGAPTHTDSAANRLRETAESQAVSETTEMLRSGSKSSDENATRQNIRVVRDPHYVTSRPAATRSDGLPPAIADSIPDQSDFSHGQSSSSKSTGGDPLNAKTEPKRPEISVPTHIAHDLRRPPFRTPSEMAQESAQGEEKRFTDRFVPDRPQVGVKAAQSLITTTRGNVPEGRAEPAAQLRHEGIPELRSASADITSAAGSRSSPLRAESASPSLLVQGTGYSQSGAPDSPQITRDSSFVFTSETKERVSKTRPNAYLQRSPGIDTGQPRLPQDVATLVRQQGSVRGARTSFLEPLNGAQPPQARATTMELQILGESQIQSPKLSAQAQPFRSKGNAPPAVDKASVQTIREPIDRVGAVPRASSEASTSERGSGAPVALVKNGGSAAVHSERAATVHALAPQPLAEPNRDTGAILDAGNSVSRRATPRIVDRATVDRPKPIEPSAIAGSRPPLIVPTLDSNQVEAWRPVVTPTARWRPVEAHPQIQRDVATESELPTVQITSNVYGKSALTAKSIPLELAKPDLLETEVMNVAKEGRRIPTVPGLGLISEELNQPASGNDVRPAGKEPVADVRIASEQVHMKAAATSRVTVDTPDATPTRGGGTTASIAVNAESSGRSSDRRNKTETSVPSRPAPAVAAHSISHSDVLSTPDRSTAALPMHPDARPSAQPDTAVNTTSVTSSEATENRRPLLSESDSDRVRATNRDIDVSVASRPADSPDIRKRWQPRMTQAQAPVQAGIPAPITESEATQSPEPKSRDEDAGLQSLGLSTTEGRSGASASAPVVAAYSRHDTSGAVLRQLVEAATLLKDGPVELRLNPEELGRVRMQMVTSDQGIVMNITSERPETLDLLRRNIDQLQRDLTQLGYTSVSFSFGQSGQGGTNLGAQRDSEAEASNTPTSVAPPPQTSQPVAHISDGLDIRL
ncbi:Flagellar hook-length control protein FliK [Puniceibacterium sp. IMCC21224]|nr:Flagellar hook-length control protein FliK [Puniceibacterium sp. IMCC21224]